MSVFIGFGLREGRPSLLTFSEMDKMHRLDKADLFVVSGFCSFSFVYP